MYNESGCDKYWNKTKRHELKIGTLHHWAKLDNYEEYRKFIIESKFTQGHITESLAGSHYDTAKLFMLPKLFEQPTRREMEDASNPMVPPLLNIFP